jgi:SAM-dependent methyltransferase
MDPRTRWGSGNYASAADKVSAVGEHVVEAVGLRPGMEALDVACGTGNATVPAARAGARVTGVDSSPDLLATARERAADAMVEIDWVEADIEQLPFADASFDRVISTFGHMFAPDHERTAAEMTRVCRGGGAIGVCCWTPQGAIGRMFAMVAQLVPPPGGASPLLWGTEEHVRELLGDAAVFERREVEWRDSSVESYADFMLESFGPLLNAQKTLGERAGELRAAYVSYLEQENLESDGALRFRGEYLSAVIKL